MKALRSLLAYVATAWLLTSGAVCAQDAGQNATSRCSALANGDFSHVRDAPTHINYARMVEATAGLPARCEVEGYVSPQVGILMWLPSEWNGKFLEAGCGGSCGILRHITACRDPVIRGYACIVTDMGHRGGRDFLWAYHNLQALIDFAYRATHVTALTGKALVRQFYGKPASRSYYCGCSGGGWQGLISAQRFPRDFDGIVAGDPTTSWRDFSIRLSWYINSIEDTDGTAILDEKAVTTLHRAIVKKCDMNDGVIDGVIGDPRKCAFDPATLACGPGGPQQCLSPKQVLAAKKLYSPPDVSGFPPGAELDNFGIGTYQGFAGYFTEYFRYVGFATVPEATWTIGDLDVSRDFDGLAQSEVLLSASNPDLRQFKSHGGKFILYHGWADGNAAEVESIDYYETVEKVMGGRAPTQDFFRLFMVPGMGHCDGGDGASTIDYLSYLENWVEHGKAPDRMIGANVKRVARNDSPTARPEFPIDPADINFTRPVFPYPLQARYKGAGDPNDAANFVPAEQH